MRLACLALAASALSTSVSAAQVVSYDNSGADFVWVPWLTFSDGFVVLDERALDITLSPTDNQAGSASAERAVTCSYNFPITSSEVLLDVASRQFPGGLAQVVTDGPVSTGFDSGFLAKTYAPGDTIGPSEAFMNSAVTTRHPIGGPEPLIGATATIGVRVPADASAGTFHYGYVVLEWQEDLVLINNKGTTSTLDLYQPIAWAYESTPETPITVPTGSTCLPDANGDGQLTPADFNAWIIAFNNQTPACDQNGDGLCTPADLNAWILNYNAGC